MMNLAYNIPMSLMSKFFLAVRFVGLRATLRTILYSLYQRRIEKKFPNRQPAEQAIEIRPEKLEKVTPFHAGALFFFNDDLRLEVSFLSPVTARVSWHPGTLPVEYAVESDLTVALQVKTQQVGESWQLSAGAITVIVHPDGKVVYAIDGKAFRQDDPPWYRSPGWRSRTSLTEDADLFGMGERAGYHLRPGAYRLWNNDIGGSYGPGADPLYLNIPIYYCRQDIGSYLVFHENSHAGLVRFDQFAEVEFADGALRSYVIYGPLPEVLKQYSRLTGRAPLPPHWALGYHQCRWGYKSAEDVRDVVAGFKKHDLPLDVFHLDIDYMDGYRVFTFNQKNFPDIKGLTDELEADGIKLVTIIDPGVKIDRNYHVYQTGLQQDAFCKLPDDTPVRGLVWPGWVHFPDFTNPLTRRWWGELYRPFIEAGVAGFWHDMNEPAAFSAFGEPTLPRATRHNLDGREGDHNEGHNLYGAFMNKAGYEGISRIAPEKRPWLLTRSGWAGVQRYAWKWTGDVESSWDALKMTIGTVLGTGISGVPFSGSDIGGFSGSPDAELFTRWFQMSAFMALFRSHAAAGTPLREPWRFGDPYLSICRDFLNIRRTLIPYLYSLAWEANQTGAPLVRPLSWVDPDDHRLWEVGDQFMLGSSLLIAPVVEPGAVSRKVVFPNGRWYSYWDDIVVEGGGDVEVAAPLERIPVFVREGAVLPKNKNGERALHCYLPAEQLGDVTSLVYSDEGDGYGKRRVDSFSVVRRGNNVVLNWKRDGDYPVDDQVRIVMHGARIGRAWLDGVEIEWSELSAAMAPFSTLRLELG
jgi:alpha-glucosidase